MAEDWRKPNECFCTPIVDLDFQNILKNGLAIDWTGYIGGI